MGKIITKALGINLIKAGKAHADGLVFDEHRDKTYMAITRYDDQRLDHYPVGAGDLRDTTEGTQANIEAGLQ